MSALHELAANVQERFGIECRLECPETVLIRNHVMATHLFRIAQEAINNALKHGKARRVVVALKPAEGKIKLTVTDDGLGFKAGVPPGAGMALQIMKYRAAMAEAVLDVASGPGAGTTVTCVFDRNL
jgi:two-component system CheB/CheR fusion protein